MTPACEHCEHHEEMAQTLFSTSGKQKALWGVVFLIVGSIGGLFYFVNNESKECNEKSAYRDKLQAQRIETQIEKKSVEIQDMSVVVNEIKINLKNLMQHQGVVYVEVGTH